MNKRDVDKALEGFDETTYINTSFLRVILSRVEIHQGHTHDIDGAMLAYHGDYSKQGEHIRKMLNAYTFMADASNKSPKPWKAEPDPDSVPCNDEIDRENEKLRAELAAVEERLKSVCAIGLQDGKDLATAKAVIKILEVGTAKIIGRAMELEKDLAAKTAELAAITKDFQDAEVVAHDNLGKLDAATAELKIERDYAKAELKAERDYANMESKSACGWAKGGTCGQTRSGEEGD